MVGLTDLEKQFSDVVDTIVWCCLFARHACSLRDEAFRACSNTAAAKESSSFHCYGLCSPVSFFFAENESLAGPIRPPSSAITQFPYFEESDGTM